MRSSFLKKTVGAALQSLNPVSVTADKILDYGYVLGWYSIMAIINLDIPQISKYRPTSLLLPSP